MLFFKCISHGLIGPIRRQYYNVHSLQNATSKGAIRGATGCGKKPPDFHYIAMMSSGRN